MQVWRLNINPDSDEDVNPRKFCFENNVLGFGWPVDTNSGQVDWKDYEEKAESKYGSSWRKAINGLKRKMQEGDLCWTRDYNGTYYLGKVEGPWRYEDSPPHKRADIVNVRDCRWVKVGASDKVPGRIVDSYPGMTLQKVNGDTVREYSGIVYRQYSGEEKERVGSGDLFDLLNSEDLEDIVGLYLQEQGYRLIPSTSKKSNPKYEYILKHRETGRRAYVQVKRGREALAAEEYDFGDGTTFLFTPNGAQKGSAPNVEFIQPETIRTFIRENTAVLPDRVQAWVKVLEQ